MTRNKLRAEATGAAAAAFLPVEEMRRYVEGAPGWALTYSRGWVQSNNQLVRAKEAGVA